MLIWRNSADSGWTNEPNTNNEKRILEAACRLFSEHGYDNVSTRQIAEEAKAPHGSLRYHFSNKETLYTEVFRKVYDLDNALTYDVLLKQEPFALDTPEGKAYAIKRVVFDYFQRHVFIPDPWRQNLIRRELENRTEIFFRLVNEGLKEESVKMSEFYFRLRPDASQAEAFYRAHLPDTQGLYYFMAEGIVKDHFKNHFDRDFDRDAREGLDHLVVVKTAKLMIMFLDLPVPPMLD